MGIAHATPTSRAGTKDRPANSDNCADTKAPIPAKASWPNDSCPASPVTTTRDRQSKAVMNVVKRAATASVERLAIRRNPMPAVTTKSHQLIRAEETAGKRKAV